jgi:hypothetical protein
MQVKPRFETYKIVEQHSLLKDDTGNEFCLTLLEVKLPSDDDEITETPYKFWTVVGKNQYKWSNKSVSHESIAFWRSDTRKNLFKGTVQGIIIEEIEDGIHTVIDKDKPGLRTRFKITKKLDLNNVLLK